MLGRLIGTALVPLWRVDADETYAHDAAVCKLRIHGVSVHDLGNDCRQTLLSSRGWGQPQHHPDGADGD